MTRIEAVGEMPLEYMLRVMRDRTADQKRRDRMAVLAAPYCHLRADLGKKHRAAEAAKTAGTDGEWEYDLL
jgi:hypothetical protein